MKTKNKPSRQKTIFIAISLITIISGAILAFPASSRAETGQVPVVALWVPWNTLALQMDEIEKIPVEKINAVILSFNPPIRDGTHGTHIKEAIQRFHNRGIKVIAFSGMEFNPDTYNTDAQARVFPGGEGDEYPHTFQVALQADGTPILKGDTEGNHIASFFDHEYQEFYARKLKLYKDCGADYVEVGEYGWSMNRTLTTEALNQFVAETGTYLPTTELGSTLSTYLAENPSVNEKLWMWKWDYLFSWLSSLGTVDSAARWNKNCPVYPGQKINSVTGFLANDPPTADTYATILNKIDGMRVTNALNISMVQYYVGNTGTPTPYPEDIYNRAKFLAQNTQGFEFYGSQYFLQYKDFVKYLPNLADYASPYGQSGDLNSDGAVNLLDFNILKSDFLKLTGSLANPKSDIDGDGQATIKDAGIMMSGWKP